jgi:hypothetical protein
LDNVDKTTYAWIDDQGRAWELSDDQLEYLRTRFHPNDGARPYVKQTYDQRTPDGRLSGFLRTKDLPSGHEISRNTRPQPSDRQDS